MLAKAVSEKEEKIQGMSSQRKETVHDKIANNEKKGSEGSFGWMQMGIPENLANDKEGKTKTGF